MAYERVNWENLPSTNTPLNATNLNKIENELEVVDKSLKYIEKTTLTLGDYFDTIDVNEVTKNGNVVQVVFRGHTKKSIPNNTVFATLPYQTKSSNVVALSTMWRYSLGNFIFSYIEPSSKDWRCGDISTDKWVQADFVYITSD